MFSGNSWLLAIATIESLYAKKSGKLIKLSEQNVIDCSFQYDNNGCDGGLMNNAFNFIKQNGISTEESYPYQAKV